MNVEVEDTLLEWISERCSEFNHLWFCVSRKLIKAEARKLRNEGQSVDTTGGHRNQGAGFNDGWAQKFLNRNGLSIR